MPNPINKTAVAGNSNTTSKMTAEQLRQLLMNQPDLVTELRNIEAEKVTELSNQLDAKFAECKGILAEIEAIRPDFSAPWNKAPQQCALDIQKYMNERGGSAEKGDIVAALEEAHTSGKVEKTLTSRLSGERPLWTYANDTDTYTLIKGKKN